MQKRRLTQAVSASIESRNDELCWQLYCAYFANPFAQAMTYEEFKGGGKSTGKKSKPTSEGKDIDIEKQLLRSKKILGSFVPPMKEVKKHG
ncbi:MAG: hypothetical protein LUD19_01965 [Clostridia bacterium]|nr:hypothetical protein [Clostridia bacterium]